MTDRTNNTKIINLVLIGAVLLIAAKCGYRGETIEGIPITDLYNSCPDEYYDFGEIITIGDPNDKFMIGLPYSWAIQENYTDTLYGITASNMYDAGNDPEKFMMISIYGYHTNDSLFSYFSKEIIGMKKDKNTIVKELGEIEFNNEKSYWVKFENYENDDKLINFVQYIKTPAKSEVYLLQSTILHTENYMEKICFLKQIVNSFEIENE